MNFNETRKNIYDDLIAGIVVFLVALPLCMGIALASNAPLFSGVITGIVGGIIVGLISGSQTSVSGPAAGLTAIVAAQIAFLGSFEAFLTAVVLAGMIQVVMGMCKLGHLAVFFPSSVIKGLLAAIGIILILKQIPHLVGHDVDPIGSKSFFQLDEKNTITEIIDAWYDITLGPTVIGLLSLFILIVWDKVRWLKESVIPSALVVVLFGVLMNFILRSVGADWVIEPEHLVQVPIANDMWGIVNFLMFPDLSVLGSKAVYGAAITIAAVASLETLLNIEAVDKIDPLQRTSPPNRELLAQGIGNICSGLIGGLPMTSVIVRSSVNINAGGKTKLSAIWHAVLLSISVLLIPQWLNLIPLSALAAILLVTGVKLASPQLFIQMLKEGKYQFLPFIITVIAIVFSDLLIGVLIGLGVSISFILYSNMRMPMKKIVEKHVAGDEVLHIELPSQVGFFSKPFLESALRSVPHGGHVLLDANNTDYIDPDVLDLIADFKNKTASAHHVELSLVGFKDKYPQLADRIQYMDYSSREIQDTLTPEKVLEILKEGNHRFRNGTRLTRDLGRQLDATARGQFPIAVILSCIDSRAPTELVFDLSLGDVLSVRVAGNIVSEKILGSIEFSCAIAGAKLILVMGHTSCGAVNTAIDLACREKTAGEATVCKNLDSLIEEIQHSVDTAECKRFFSWGNAKKKQYADEVASRNVFRAIQKIQENSPAIKALISKGKLGITGALYNVATGEVLFLEKDSESLIT